VGKKPTPLVDDAGNMHFTCKKGGVHPADLGKQKNLDITTGLKINKKIFFSNNPKEIYSIFNM
jgi:hypothetical protein